MRSRIVAVFAGALLVAGLIAGPVTTPRADAQATAWMYVDTVKDIVINGGWAVGASVTVAIDDPEVAGSPDYTAVGTADQDGSADFDLAGVFDVEPGQTVTVTDGTMTKTHVATPLLLTGVNAQADAVSGTALAGTVVHVEIFGGPVQDVTVEPSGDWTADFSPSSGYEFDLVPGTGGNAIQLDDDGDATHVNWQVPNPIFWLNADTDGSAGVSGLDWARDGSVTIDVNGELRATTATDGSGELFVSAPGVGFVVEGDLVTVSDGSSTKTLTVTSLTVDVDPDADTVSGTALEDNVVSVGVFGGPNQDVIADASGEWIADFSPGSGFEFDLAPGTDGNAVVSDEDGDATNVHWRIPNPTFTVVVGNPVGLFGSGWQPDSLLTITVNGASVAPGTTSDGGGGFQVNPALAVGSGDIVAVSDGAATKEHEVTGVTVTGVEFALDLVAGTAEPGSTVSVMAATGWPGCFPSCPDTANRYETADPSGNWTADFSVPGDEPGMEDAIHDLTAQSGGFAAQSDGDGDSTWDMWASQGGPGPGATLDVEPSTDLVDGQSITLTGSGWPAGATLYVTECRLDVGLSPQACDPTTEQTYTVEPDGTLPATSEYMVTQEISTGFGVVDCGLFLNSCGLVGVVWPGPPLSGNPIALDYPNNNIINFTGAVARVPIFYLNTAPSGPTVADVNGSYWAPNTLVTIEVDGTPQSPDATAYTDPFGNFTTSGSGPFVEVGDEVTVFDGISTKAQVVPPLTVTEVDVGSDKVKGTADPDGLDPFVQVQPTPVPLAETFASMTDGDWTADFSTATGDDPYDIVAGTWGLVFQYDDDGDATVTQWVAPAESGSVEGDIIDPQGNPVVGASVYLNDSPPSAPPPGQYLTSTDASGHFVTPPIPVGTYQLRFEGEPGEGLVGTTDVTVEANTTTTLPDPVQLERHTTIWGTILDENGDPVPGNVVSSICGWVGPVGYGCDGLYLQRNPDASGLFQHTTTGSPGEMGTGTYTAGAAQFSGTWQDLQSVLIEVPFEVSEGDQVFCEFTLRSDPTSTEPRTASCTAGDGDGVVEPRGYDGNDDGVDDADQANVTTLANAVDQQYVTIAAPDGTTLANVTAIDPASLPTPPDDATLPVGVLSFEVHGVAEGATVEVEVFTPAATNPNAYLKYQDDAWVVFTDHASFTGDVVTLTLTDGGAGDADHAANGVIVDPGAPAVVTTPPFDFDGFFAPVNNPPVRNSVKAGRAIPVKFSLGGDQGLDIFADGYPKSHKIDCDTEDPIDEIESTVTAGNSTLTYDASSGRYHYVWKTNSDWDGCRQLVLKLTDGTTHKANFDFK